MSEPLFTTLKSAVADGAVSQHDLRKFTEHLTSLPAYKAARINPFEFASEAGLPAETAIELFVQGTRAGVFDMEWGVVCPMCGAIMQSVTHLDKVAEGSVFCAFCQTDIDSVLDDTVEVSFAYQPPGQPLELHSDFDAYRYYFTASSFPYRDQFTAYQKRNAVSDHRLAPGERVTWRLPIKPDQTYRLFSHDTHDAINIAPGDAEAPATLALGPKGFEPSSLVVSADNPVLDVRNETDTPVWLRLVEVHMDEIYEIIEQGTPVFGPRLTGKHLLNNQTFRDHFSFSHLDPDLKLKLRSLTLLFTDLSGSTALYDREGDLAAYRLVQDHFTALKDVVRANSGAMIKTMGDAVMAAFPSAGDGARAAVEMMQAMERIAEQDHGDEVGLKVGLHSGPALAINAGQSVDYFGQTVNIAARVQGLAQAGDICVTRALSENPDVPNALSQAGYAGQEELAHLKGVSSEEHILRYRHA